MNEIYYYWVLALTDNYILKSERIYFEILKVIEVANLLTIISYLELDLTYIEK